MENNKKNFWKGALAGALAMFMVGAAALGIILALLGFCFIRDIAGMLGAKGELLENCVIYGRVILIGLPFYVLQEV